MSLRKRSTTVAGWLPGFISDTLVSKNAELAPSASCRVNALEAARMRARGDLGGVGHAIGVRIAGGAVGARAAVGIEAISSSSSVLMPSPSVSAVTGSSRRISPPYFTT